MEPSRSGSAANLNYYSWCKVKMLDVLVQRFSRPGASAPSACTRLLFLDSDAYVREQFLTVPQLLAALGPAIAGADIVLSRENPLTAPSIGIDFRTTFGLNTGVLFLAASNWTRALLRAWASLQHTVCKGKLFRYQAEQKCLERLLTDQRQLLPRDATRRIAHVPMQEFNSPWGRFARHVWGGEGRHLRAAIYDDELRMQGVWTEQQQQALVAAARHGTMRVC